MPAPDEITLKTQRGTISGWTDFRLTVDLETCTREVAFGMTEAFPGQAGLTIAQPGDAFQVFLGNDLVHTGFINRFHPRVVAKNHTVLLQGRGKCQDLVDCSAEWPGNQMSGVTALTVAQNLAAAYKGLVVGGEAGQVIPQLNVIVGETAWDIIDRVVKYSGLIAYELPDGSLTLASVGSAPGAASGISEGKNAQDFDLDWNDYQRYSDYESHLIAFDSTGEVPDNGTTVKSAHDPNVLRHRLYKFITEADGGQGAVDLGTARANWEMNRRAGHSAVLTTKTDSWRDGAGALWQPNSLIPVAFPTLKLPSAQWLIAGMVLSKLPAEAGGTTATLKIMPPYAFAPEPIVFQPGMADVNAAIAASQAKQP